MRKFADSLDDGTKKDYKLIETAFKKFCKTQKNKEHRFVSSPRPFCRQTGCALTHPQLTRMYLFHSISLSFSLRAVLLSGRSWGVCHRYIEWAEQTIELGNASRESLWEIEEEGRTNLRFALRYETLDICPRVQQDYNKILIFVEKQIDLNNVDLKKLKVRDLKKILNDWDEGCDGCLEKTDFIKRIEELKPKYSRNEL